MFLMCLCTVSTEGGIKGAWGSEESGGRGSKFHQNHKVINKVPSNGESLRGVSCLKGGVS